MARGSATGLSISTLSGTARPVVSAELPAGMVSRISARYKTGAKSRGVERKIGRKETHLPSPHSRDSYFSSLADANRSALHGWNVPANNVPPRLDARSRWGVPVTNPSCGTRAFSIKLPVGRRHDESWRRWSFMLGSCSRVWVHRDQSGDAEPGGSAVLQQAGDSGAVDQGGQAGGEDDAAVLSSVPLKSVRLALSLLAYNLGNMLRRLGLPRGIENCP